MSKPDFEIVIRDPEDDAKRTEWVNTQGQTAMKSRGCMVGRALIDPPWLVFQGWRTQAAMEEEIQLEQAADGGC